ncbi:phage tail tip lysozyme [Mammaliicoccus sciuri]|uniref:phage tail tip lysozyme n=1 Tax=Mammaliicoccus sciuri TaxID=1296 RepID=UPI001FB4728F|nr:phage tail tip lysozyme [Mammaliicoccus sciuri]MCJ0941421.1 phage tail tip lysozyme [Mammaliicoccus sciuri]
MDKKHTHKLLRPIKVMTSIAILSTCMPFVDDFENRSSNEVKADQYSVLEGQYGCYDTSSKSDSDDEGSNDKESTKSKKELESDIPNAENIEKIYDEFHGKHGFSAEFIAGITANWVKEAQLDPTANEPVRFGVKSAKEATNGTLGIGWGQWSFERHKALVDHSKKLKKDWWEPEVQLDYMATQDGMYVDILKDLALNSGDNPVEEAVNFHDQWERSRDSRETIMNERGQVAKDILKYMKANGMDGKKDESKIKKMSSGKSKSTSAASSANDTGEKVVKETCGKKEESGGGSKGKLGESTKVNGKKGKTITQNYEYKDLPEKYKKYISAPKFDEKFLKKDGNVFATIGGGKLIGQCTELTWAYMYQLHGKMPPNDGNGNMIYKAYEREGAKVTDKPTVGYGFSSNPPQAGAGDPITGHTGVVVGVMPDGKWIMANYNVPPKPAPSRTLYYTVVDGTDGEIKFFGAPKK